jgi:indole-3-glycerol phosphate synthase
MDILDKIMADKRREVKERKQQVPPEDLEAFPHFKRPVLSLRDKLDRNPAGGIIAEFKRKSPSRGMIKETADPVEITRGYKEAGACGLSVLTDNKYFAGSPEDLIRVREAHHLPILRKDFMIEEYQILEARAWGADVVLLIAAVLGKERIRDLSRLASSIGLEVLLEVHREAELALLNEYVDMVGVNNRDLKKMVTDVNTSLALAEKIPADFLKISESGISNAGTMLALRAHGYRGFLIGEYFMQSPDPAGACRRLIDGLQTGETD